MRVAVTGAGGRLGRALVEAFARRAGSVDVRPWSRPDYDLDAPAGAERLLDRDRPDVVVHAAAWTDVDGCARDPGLALARNGEAVERLARACVERGVDLLVVSTNEVFDGRRTDGRGYRVDDPPNPINTYGASKLAGEVAALRAYGWRIPWGGGPWGGRPGMGGPGAPAADGASPTSASTASASASGSPASGPPAPGPRCTIVRTAWLFGPPGNDFPSKIVAAARSALRDGRPLRVVADEVGSPTYTVDLAAAIVRLLELEAGRPARSGGPIRHLVNAGRASRAEWARATLRLAGLEVPVVDISSDEWPRASTPPRWAVLDPGPLPPGLTLRSWDEALAAYLTPVRPA